MRPIQVLRRNLGGATIEDPDPENPTDPTDPVQSKAHWATMKVIVGAVDRKGIPQQTQVKSLSTGQLMSIDPSPAGENIIRGSVYTQSWNQYEAVAGTYVMPSTGTSFMNTAQTKGLQVRCRAELGLAAPSHAKSLNGGPLQMYDHGTSTDGSITPFTVGWLWELNYWTKANNLQTWLGDTLSAWDVFKELSLSHDMTYFQEPMIWQLSFRGQRNPDGSWLYKPNTMLMWETFIADSVRGYTYSKHLGTYERTIDQAKVLLKDTHAKNFVFNSPMQFVQNSTPNNAANATMGTNTATTDRLIERGAATEQMVLMNHSLRLWPVNSTYDKMYKKFAASGAPASYQTINLVNSWWDSNPSATMFGICQKAVEEYGAFSLELAGTSPQYLSKERSGTIAQAAGQTRQQLNYEQLQYLNNQMQNNYDAFKARKAAEAAAQ